MPIFTPTHKLILFTLALALLGIVYWRSRKSARALRLLGIVGSVYAMIYLVWRITSTLPPVTSAGFVFGLLLVIFETLAIGQSLLFKLLFSSQRSLSIERSAPFEGLPTVDVIISTYNEPLEILERTLVSCREIDYPQELLTIYLGDDGRRQEVMHLCERYGVHYITRDDNDHAKAGNINNVLKGATGDLILMLDADMIPREDIVRSMVFYFEDPSTGFVQSPQVFYNLDPFQYNLNVGASIPNEQDFFMRTIEQKRALYNAVLHVGTNALFRRSALDAIGGIPTGAITEDMATGMLLQNGGYKSFFVADTLAVGLSVEGVEDLIKQRDRWLRGNIQVIKKYNPFKMKGLDLYQKLIYLDGFVYWLFGLQKMVYILAPLLYLLLRLTVFEAHGFDIALMFLPYFLSSSLYFRSVSDRGRNMTWSHIYDTAIAPQMALSFLSEFFFKKETKFHVTPKGLSSEKDLFRTRLASIHLILFTLSLVALIGNITLLGTSSGGLNVPALVINLIWCAYNGLAIFISIFLYLDRRRFRKSERIPTDLKASALIRSCAHHENCDSCGRVLDISEKGARIQIKSHCPHFTFEVGAPLTLSIDTIGIVRGTVKRVEMDTDTYLMGVAFSPVGFEAYAKINRYRFDLNNRYVRHTRIDPEMDSFGEILFKLFARFQLRWRPEEAAHPLRRSISSQLEVEQEHTEQTG